MENLDIFGSNGFGITVDEDAPYGQGEKIRLIAMPVSKETTFDEKGKFGVNNDHLIAILKKPHLRRPERIDLFAARAIHRNNGSVQESSGHVCLKSVP